MYLKPFISPICQLVLSFSIGTLPWSSSCSLTPSWALLFLKLWVSSVWWLHSSFCLPCNTVVTCFLLRYTLHCHQEGAVWMPTSGSMTSAHHAIYSQSLVFLKWLWNPWCMKLGWTKFIVLMMVLPIHCIFNQMFLLRNLWSITEVKHLIHPVCAYFYNADL